jgi:DNA modification methylase
MAERLSDAEIRDITKALEDGRPLDEKYRYLIFKESRQVELVWNGKSTYIPDIALPFQTIEHIDEPRDETRLELQQSLFDTSGKKIQGWTNKLIWGDNKYVLSSLKNGPIREEIEANGGIKLIYIDPPFDVGADFTTTIEIGDTAFDKAPTILEEIAFRDTWGKGQDSFLAMIYERLKIMHSLLADDGFIFVHCDFRTTSTIRLLLDEIFGADNYRNEIIWKRKGGSANPSTNFGVSIDTIHFYAKSEKSRFFPQYTLESDEAQGYIRERFRYEFEGRKYMLAPIELNKGLNSSPSLLYEYKGYRPPNGWMMSREKLEKFDAENKLHWNSKGRPNRRVFLDEYKGQPIENLWTDIFVINPMAAERMDYPTQKPEALLRRIIESTTQEGDVVADFFAGSGTTASVAEKMNRKWITSDIGRFSIHTSRKRLIGVQRELKKKQQDFRAFDILSVGSYSYNEPQHQTEFNELVLSAYKAEVINNSIFSGRKGNRYVAVGPLDLPTSRDFIDELVMKCIQNKIVEVDILAFEFGMGVAPEAVDDAMEQGVKLNLKIIPREVFDKKAVADGAVKFSDVGYLDAKIKADKKDVRVQLTDFSIFYSQDSLDLNGQNLQKGKSKVVLDNGIIKKISKDKDGIVKIEDIATSWVDWIDYWAIDFNFSDRAEIRTVKNELGEYEQVETGRHIFENQWQSFKTKEDDIELESSPFQYATSGKYQIAVKVIDAFGNDTTRIFEVNIGK